MKGIENFCDPKKIELISEEFDLQKIWTDDAFKNPCVSYKIPFYLAFNEYFHANNPKNAALYYKIASANEESVE